MNETIKRELDKILAPLPDYDDNTTHIHIEKKVEPQSIQLVVGQSYIAQLADYILNEPPNFTLSANWNKGVVPKSAVMLVQIREIAGKMLKVHARGYDDVNQQYLEDMYYDLWLPSAGITIISEF